MRSQKPTEHLAGIVSTDEEDIRCYPHPSYMFNRDTCQMSPLLFESDTDEASQSSEIKCYQERIATPQPTPMRNCNRLSIDNLSPFIDFRNEITSQPDTSSRHDRCCSETLLNSTDYQTIIEAKEVNSNNAYISPSPRVTRSKWLKSRILTRSAKRLHKISELNEYSESLRNTRKRRTRTDFRQEKINSSDGWRSNSKASEDEEKLFEAIRKRDVRVVLERLKFPFFQNPHQVNGKFIRPNIVPNIKVIDDEEEDLDFLNRRLSSEVQILTERPAVISISSDSTIRNVSPELFENLESSSVLNLGSQNSFDIQNGQIVMRSSIELTLSQSVTSTPTNQHDFTLKPSISDLINQDEMSKLEQPHTFEITVNEVFDNVIQITESDETFTPQIANHVDESHSRQLQQQPNHTVTGDNSGNLIHSKRDASSQEITPKKRPQIRGLLNKSVGACPSNPSTSLNRSKWLSKPKSDVDLSNRTSQRCRRLELWFGDEKRSRKKGKVVDRKCKFSKLLLTSSEEEDS